MKITDLKEFRFDIGNTTDEDGGFVADVVAINKGILEGDELVATYEDDDIECVDDLEEIIDNALWDCPFKQEDCQGLSDVLYSEASIDIEDWWEKNYG